MQKVVLQGTYMLIKQCHNVEDLRPLAERWISESKAGQFGLEVDIEMIKKDLEIWMQGEGIVLAAYDGIQPVGFIAVFIAPSYLGNQKIAVEKYWYAIPGYLIAGPKLYIEAVKWAKENGCSHVIFGGSKMSPDRHDGICKFLESTGAKHFETLYIYRV
jgi:hypothetical protein